jgi:hypothetical protein
MTFDRIAAARRGASSPRVHLRAGVVGFVCAAALLVVAGLVSIGAVQRTGEAAARADQRFSADTLAERVRRAMVA